MPPVQVENQPTEEDFAAVALWAECLTIDAPVEDEYVSTTQAIQWMRDDLLTFQNNERRFQINADGRLNLIRLTVRDSALSVRQRPPRPPFVTASRPPFLQCLFSKLTLFRSPS